jgi:hypothetical protein
VITDIATIEGSIEAKVLWAMLSGIEKNLPDSYEYRVIARENTIVIQKDGY